MKYPQRTNSKEEKTNTTEGDRFFRKLKTQSFCIICFIFEADARLNFFRYIEVFCLKFRFIAFVTSREDKAYFPPF